MFLGVDGIKGTIADMRELGVWDTFQVKTQTIKTAIESACMLLRIDDIVSGLQNKWCVCCKLFKTTNSCSENDERLKQTEHPHMLSLSISSAFWNAFSTFVMSFD